MRTFGQAPRKRCRACKRSRPTYLLASHEEQCIREQNERQAVRQRELLEELARVQAQEGPLDMTELSDLEDGNF